MKTKIKINQQVRKGERTGFIVKESPLSTLKCQVLWEQGESRTWELKSNLKPLR